MRQYVLSEVKKARYTFVCPHPHCKQVWEYFLVRHVACLDDKTRSTIEKNVTENYISQGRGFQQCPGCQTWCVPFDEGEILLRCDVCSRDLGRPYEFCWACLRQWKGISIKSKSIIIKGCGNEGCDEKDPRIRILTVAEKMSVENIPGCPSIRACPNCGLLINLKGGCRRITCTNCKAEFCFMCLRRWNQYHDVRTCFVAPVQVDLSAARSWKDQNDHVQPAPGPQPAPRVQPAPRPQLAPRPRPARDRLANTIRACIIL